MPTPQLKRGLKTGGECIALGSLAGLPPQPMRAVLLSVKNGDKLMVRFIGKSGDSGNKLLLPS